MWGHKVVHLPDRQLAPDWYRLDFPYELVKRAWYKPGLRAWANAGSKKGKWLGSRLYLDTKGVFFLPGPT